MQGLQGSGLDWLECDLLFKVLENRHGCLCRQEGEPFFISKLQRYSISFQDKTGVRVVRKEVALYSGEGCTGAGYAAK